MVLLLWGIFFVFKKNNLPKKHIDSVKTVNYTVNNLSDKQVKKVVSKTKSKNKDLSKEKDYIKNKEIVLLKKSFNKAVYKIYNLVNNYGNSNKPSAYDVLNNSKMSLLQKFSYSTYYSYLWVDQLLGNFKDIKWLNSFIRSKYFNKFKFIPKEKVVISVDWEKNIDKLLVNSQRAIKRNDKYYYQDKWLVYLTITILKKWCVPGIYKVSYSPTINLTYKCVKLYRKTSKDIVNGELKLNNNISLDIWNKGIDYVEYNILNQENGENNWMLNLPVISKDWKILSNHFTTYGMPYIKMYKNGQLVNGCVLWTEKLINYTDLKNKVLNSSIKEMKWYDTLFLNKKIWFWWRNLNEKKWIWEPWEIMFINKNKGIIKFKYCYNFN